MVEHDDVDGRGKMRDAMKHKDKGLSEEIDKFFC